jgi:hypothetical protein
MKPGAAQPELPADAGEATIARLDKLRNASGSLPVAKLRKRLQVAMQQDAAVFRTEVPSPAPGGRPWQGCRAVDQGCRVPVRAGGGAPPRRTLRCCCSPCEHC